MDKIFKKNDCLLQGKEEKVYLFAEVKHFSHTCLALAGSEFVTSTLGSPQWSHVSGLTSIQTIISMVFPILQVFKDSYSLQGDWGDIYPVCASDKSNRLFSQ